MRSGTDILPVGLCGIGILPMIHGLEGPPNAEVRVWEPRQSPTREIEIASSLRFS
jgi:hypothetical protein